MKNRILILLLLAITGLFSEHITGNKNGLILMKNPSSGWLNTKGNIGYGYAAEYQRLYAGLGDGINKGQFAVFREMNHYGYALALSAHTTEMYYRSDLYLPIVIKVGNVHLGSSLRYTFDGFNFNNMPDSIRSSDPLYNGSENAQCTALDCGISINLRKLQLAFSWNGIMPVNLGGATSVDEPQRLNIGVLTSIQKLRSSFYVDCTYELDAPYEDNYEIAIGVNTKIARLIDIQLSVSNREALFGLLFNLAGTMGFSENKEFKAGLTANQPIGEMKHIGNTFKAAIYGSSEKEIPLPDLAVSCDAFEEAYLTNQPIETNIEIANVGKQGTSEYNLLIIDNGDTTKRAMEGIGSQGKVNVEHSFIGKSSGTKIVKFAIAYEKPEINKENNELNITIDIAPKPEIDILTESSVLSLKSISYMYQDEGVVPTVFFDKGSSMVDSRFNDMLMLIIERLKANPDINLNITGFMSHDEIDPKLAFSRARTVYDRLSVLSLSIDETGDVIKQVNILNKSDSLMYYSQRSSQNKKVQQERRRVDFGVSISNSGESIQRDNEDILTYFRRIQKVLDSNPELVFVIENQLSNKADALRESARLRKDIIHTYGEKYLKRVFPAISQNVSSKAGLNGFLSASGLLYKPEIVHASSNFEPGNNMACDMKLITKGLPIKRWSVDLIDPDGKIDIQNGENTPPSDIIWDFKDNDGNMIAVDKNYELRFDVTDIAEQVDTAISSRKVSTRIEGNEIRTEKLLLVQFMFNQPSAKSRYLDDRLSVIAENLIRTISEYDSTSIIFEGHSDDIGSLRRNMELSQERADAVKDRMTMTMAALLDTDIEGFNRWLDEHNASISAEGFAYTKPYTVSMWKGNSKFEKLKGDNNLPEGRTINRCVIMSIESKR